MLLRIGTALAALAATHAAFAQLAPSSSGSTMVVATGSTRARAISDHLGDAFKALNFGNCTWDGSHDVAPCIQAAINAAGSTGGGIVQVPAGHWPIASPLTIGTSGVGMQGQGIGVSRDTVNPYQYLSVTSLVWTGTVGGTMLTVAPGGSLRLYKTDVLDLVLDCAGLAGTCLRVESTSFSIFRVGYSEPKTVGALFTTTGTLTDTQSAQYNDMTVVGRSTQYPATGIRLDSGNCALGNVSITHATLLSAWRNNGDGIVFGCTDHIAIDKATIGRQPGGTAGKDLVFANSAYPGVGGQAWNNRIGYFGGGQVYALGFQSGSTIAAGSGNHGNGTAGSLTINSPAPGTQPALIVTGGVGYINSAAPGTYKLTATSATQFTITPPSGGHSDGTLTVGAPYVGDFSVTITAGSVPFQAGDSFTIQVPAPSSNNAIGYFDFNNGNPAPIIEAGSSLWLNDDYGDVNARYITSTGGALHVDTGAPVTSQGGFLQWNRTGNGDGSTWLINQRGQGNQGGIVLGESIDGANDVRVNLQMDVWGDVTLAGSLTAAGQASAPGFMAIGGQAVSAQGGYLQWNRSGTGDGSTWFLNSLGGGNTGGWQWAKATTGNVTTVVAKLDETGDLALTGKLQLPQATPATSSAPCTAGQIGTDANYIYVCTATNTWKRAALSTF